MITIITIHSQTTKTVTVNAKELIAYKWIITCILYIH